MHGAKIQPSLQSIINRGQSDRYKLTLPPAKLQRNNLLS
jgi:hypothetical protein